MRSSHNKALQPVSLALMSAFSKYADVYKDLIYFRFQPKAGVQDSQCECLLNTESGRSGVSDDRQLSTQSGRSPLLIEIG